MEGGKGQTCRVGPTILLLNVRSKIRTRTVLYRGQHCFRLRGVSYPLFLDQVYTYISATCSLLINEFFSCNMFAQVGDIVLVTAMHLTGQWEGQINGLSGFFPFTHVKFLDETQENDGNT